MGNIKASANDLDGRKLFNWKIFVLLNKYMKPIYIYNDCFADQVLRMPKCHAVQHKWIHSFGGVCTQKDMEKHANILYGKNDGKRIGIVQTAFDTRPSRKSRRTRNCIFQVV